MRSIAVDLVEHLPGAPHSGIGRYTDELRRHLPGEFDVQLTEHVDPPFTRYGTFLHHLPLGVRNRRPGSIVHFVEDLGCSQMLWRPVRPAVATSHDLGFLAWSPEARMHPRFDRLIWRLSYLGLKRMDVVIAVSHYSRKLLIERMGIPANRVTVIHSGIDTAKFRPMADARAWLSRRFDIRDDEQRLLLYVGTEIPRKNLATLLRALRRLPPHVRLVKAGGPGHPRFRAALEAQINRWQVRDRVTLLGDVSEEELVGLYSAADVYVCCSYLEGFGHPVLEAMACGLPVVCANNTSLPEVVGDAGILVSPSDDVAVSEAVMSVLGDADRREWMVQLGLERSASFTWQRTAAAVADVYYRLSEPANHRRSRRLPQ